MSISRLTRLLVVAAVATSTIGQAFAGSCAMSTQMTSAQAQEQQRRYSNINTNFQQLQLLNQLQQACLENFPQYPTQWLGNSAAVTAAFNKIKQTSCQQLANQARATSTQAMAQAQAAVQAQIDKLESDVSHATGGSSGLLSGTVSQSMPSSSGIISDITGTLSRLFQ